MELRWLKSTKHHNRLARKRGIPVDVVPDRRGYRYQVLLADGSKEAATWLSPEFSAIGVGYGREWRSSSPSGVVFVH